MDCSFKTLYVALILTALSACQTTQRSTEATTQPKLNVVTPVEIDLRGKLAHSAECPIPDARFGNRIELRFYDDNIATFQVMDVVADGVKNPVAVYKYEKSNVDYVMTPNGPNANQLGELTYFSADKRLTVPGAPKFLSCS